MATNRNGPAVSSMYKMKPFYDTDADIELPTCMYKMKSVYGSRTGEGKGSYNQEFANSTQSNGGLEELERRQDNILSKLNVLKVKVEALKVKYSSSPVSAGVAIEQLQPSFTKPVVASTAPAITDLVITANPSSLPLSLFILGRMLSSQYRVLLSTFVHSTAKALITKKHLEIFQNQCFPIPDRNSYKYGITFIWKDEPYGPSLMVQPGQQAPIRGEANVARYLARLLSPQYDVEIVKATKIDDALDLASALLLSDQNQALNVINLIVGLLGSGKGSSVFGSGQPTLADIVIWSALKQRAVGKLPSNLQQWMDRCSNIPLFKEFVHLQ